VIQNVVCGQCLFKETNIHVTDPNFAQSLSTDFRATIRQLTACVLPTSPDACNYEFSHG
jgi:hypothetical protein